MNNGCVIYRRQNKLFRQKNSTACVWNYNGKIYDTEGDLQKKVIMKCEKSEGSFQSLVSETSNSLQEHVDQNQR